MPAELLAAGRDSDIFALGRDRVVRRSRGGHSMDAEARTMEYARRFGYPVPAVDEVRDDGTELVMERIHGPLMISVMGRQPWSVGRFGTMLADLHKRLHRIQGPDWLSQAPCGAPCGVGDRLLHFDLHPLNVILSPDGPVVIDWANAVRGDGAADVTLTWLLLASGDNPAGRVRAMLTERFRSRLVRAFLAPFDGDRLRSLLPEVATWKAADPHMSGPERASMRAMVRSECG